MKKRDSALKTLIQNAQCKVDASPPMVKLDTYLGVTKMRENNQKLKRIFAENVELIMKINRIQRIDGEVKCYNKAAGILKTNISVVNKKLKELDKANFDIGKKLLCMKPTMDTRSSIKRKALQKTSKEQEEYRAKLFQKYKSILPIQSIEAIPQLLWPKVFIDLGIKNVRPLDRLVVVLYTEAAPDIVLQFVRMCKDYKDRLTFPRVFPNLWIEGEIKVPIDSEFGTMETENPYIDHGQAGTFSLLDRKLKGKLQFSISFKPLKVLNGKQIPFGRVIGGLKILAVLQDYGTKNGKPKKEIEVTNCGLLM